MEKFNRAARRKATALIKAKRSKSYWGRLPASAMEPMSPRQAGMVANTAAPCSCHMCGNVRRLHGERTLKEIIQLIELKEARHALGN
jgi:hypothetical protein